MGTSVDITPVRYDARSFESPPYYGYRVGRLLGDRVGLEAEFIHFKVYARTGDIVSVTGRLRGVETNSTARLSATIQHLSMSHGLNFVLANVTWPLVRSEAVMVRARGGAGIAVPHAESVIDGAFREQYQIASTAFQGSASAEFRLSGRVRALAEYKLTTARSEVDVAGGTIAGGFVSHHVVFGIALHSR